MKETTQSYRSNGKLLLTAEYAVLDGAKALAIPTSYGQSLVVKTYDSDTIQWKSYNELNAVWFECIISLDAIKSYRPNRLAKHSVQERLIQVIHAAQELNSEFLIDNQGYLITTHQDFNRLWGLGTSSTLINNIALWANVNPYALLARTFGGSGYDIACAQHSTAITFQLQSKAKNPIVNAVDFKPEFRNHLYFVYLNQKQNSRDGISAYKALNKIDTSGITKINEITDQMIVCNSLSEFEILLNAHEHIIAHLIDQKPVKDRLFSDFNGAVKSLGAWGGDFVLVTSKTDPTAYFKNKGLHTVLPYKDLVL
ncbi:GYDIA family GHMP kinase [Winogradskyella sediminis]|uniref:Mevalonate kinase n=1 Tax=Winogradskyella sediminis TaxID=1382466 RepID=A0A1H1Q2J0_9FLAO|nr:GYDIA family GHMP kinase [Winogradskyella sediminis]SDS17199.1 hypothetical protein SAMN04489797_1027 [Winogradskyella sediminis]